MDWMIGMMLAYPKRQLVKQGRPSPQPDRERSGIHSSGIQEELRLKRKEEM